MQAVSIQLTLSQAISTGPNFVLFSKNMCPSPAESLLGEPAEGAFPTISSGVPPKTARVDVDPASAKELEQHITTLFGRLEALPLVDGRLHGCATLPLVESLSQGRPPSYTSRATSALILLLLALPGSRGSKLPVEKPNPGERMSARHQHTPGALDSTWKIITVPSGLMQHMLDAGELVSKGGPTHDGAGLVCGTSKWRRAVVPPLS